MTAPASTDERTLADVLIREQVARVVERALEKAQAAGQVPRVAYPEIAIERPSRPDQGDFATSFALKAKRAVGPQGPNPLAIAGAISAQIALDPPPFLATWEVAQPGFLNFTLADEWLRQQIDVVLAEGERFGDVPLGGERSVQVEFVSANPTGPLHFGNGRNAAIGDSLARVLAKAGWRVHREYYFNDAGAQVSNLHHSVWVQYQRLLGKDIPPAETDYPGEYVQDLARAIHAEHGDRFSDVPEERAAEIGSLGSARVMEWIRTELARANVQYDTWFSEASLIREGHFDAILDLLRSRDLVYEREGAVWLRSSTLGDERDRVIIRSDGRPTYLGTDIAYHYDKFFVRSFDRVINVWGADHQGQVPSIKAVVRALGVENDRFDVLVYQLVHLLRNGQPVRMGKRAGNFVTMGEVLDEVGPDAMRWFMASRSSDAMMEFDLDLAKKQSSDNPVYYVQYAHARLAKILREAPVEAALNTDVRLLTQPSELALLRRMLQLPEVVELAARQMAPHHVPHYAYELARATATWYEAGNDDPALRVLTSDERTRAARLKLADAARQVLANALGMIGVSAPEAM
ncbi:MAG: arginine--tRNA ligase [Chloroflexi bacterium]|nr:arginine--tRNA ligase [Chloroflexota bacterium]